MKTWAELKSERARQVREYRNARLLVAATLRVYWPEETALALAETLIEANRTRPVPKYPSVHPIEGVPTPKVTKPDGPKALKKRRSTR